MPKNICNSEANSDCWETKFSKSKNGKKVPVKQLNGNTTLRQWEKVTIDKKKQDEGNEEHGNYKEKSLKKATI